ncbi:thioesterase family protein [Rhodoblastus sp.]|jgi:acyl-CoA thioesterase FadM|uniref:thioesterase family protein n=1 Tax=Rhodoblastus sp. TaxID=1962975 RepID=UPI002603D8BC|nr:thioesterase family protein [Rhodoblastus sp.]
MLSSWLRLAKLLATAPFRRRIGWTGESRLRFRVWPSDLDINLHMNNARYLAAMDIGRIDLLMRTGLGKAAWRGKLKPVLASTLVRYRRSLAPFQSYGLRSRLVGWDEKWLFIEHVVERDGEIFCHAVVKGMFLGPQGGVPTHELLGLVGKAPEAPALPGWIAEWQAAEAGLRR